MFSFSYFIITESARGTINGGDLHTGGPIKTDPLKSFLYGFLMPLFFLFFLWGLEVTWFVISYKSSMIGKSDSSRFATCRRRNMKPLDHETEPLSRLCPSQRCMRYEGNTGCLKNFVRRFHF